MSEKKRLLGSPRKASIPLSTICGMSWPRSAPAQNALSPVQVSTATHSSSPASKARKASSTPVIISAVIALCASGRLNAMVATRLSVV
jgi:hypothetical protein